MKGLLITFVSIAILFVALSFADKDCQHVLVKTEQTEVKAVNYSWISGMGIVKYGKHKGDELVCVKCFILVNQVVDYGERPEWIDKYITDTIEVLTTFPNQNVLIGPIYDTTPTIGSGMAYPHGKGYKKDKRKKK